MLFRNGNKRTGGNFKITNSQEKYWLQDHISTYMRLMAVKRQRLLTDVERHQLDVCFNALSEHHMLGEVEALR